MADPQLHAAIDAGFKSITNKAFAIILPLIGAILLATFVRIGVMIYMKRLGFRRQAIDLASYLAFAITLLGLYAIWSDYVVSIAHS